MKIYFRKVKLAEFLRYLFRKIKRCSICGHVGTYSEWDGACLCDSCWTDVTGLPF